MSLPPITIDDLDLAGPIDPDGDYIPIRQGLNDKKATPGQIGNVRFDILTPLPTEIFASDLFIVGRNVGPGVYSNYTVNLQKFGLAKGTIMWFYANSAPLGWTVVPGSGDKVLATKLPGGASHTYNTFGMQKTWSQSDTTLTIQQIPNHKHWGVMGKASASSSATALYFVSAKDAYSSTQFLDQPIRGIVGAYNDNANHNNFGDCAPHNHGDQWRPAGLVGILCEKTE